MDKVTVKDDLNNEFVFPELPKRIISLAPNITETIYAIEADSLLVGVTDYCDYPREAQLKTKIGGMLDPDLEKIISLNPDLVLLTIEGNSKNTYQSLKNLGVNVFTINPRDFDGISNMINNLGIITGKENNSRMLIESLKDEKDSLKSITGLNTPKTCFIIISLTPLMTANKTTFINEIVSFAGLRNIYADEMIAYPEVSYENLILQNPDYFIFPVNLSDNPYISNSKEILKEKLYLEEKNIDKKLILIDENLLFRPGPRILNASFEILRKIIP